MQKLHEQKSQHIIIILSIALLLRLLGVWHGYPYSFYPDEAHFVKRALAFGSGDFNPHWFHKPAFYMYLLFFDYGVYFLVGKIIGLWSSVSQFAVSYIINPGPFYMIGRITTVLFSLGSIWITFKTGERHFKKGTGVFAALFLSLSYGHIVASQDIKADTPAMFFIILSMFFLLNYIVGKNTRNIILAAAIAGIGAATKAYPILMMVPIILTVILLQVDGQKDRLTKKLWRIGYFTSLLLSIFYSFYFICAPYNFLDPFARKGIMSPFIKLAEIILPIPGGKQAVSTDPAYFIGHRMGIFQGALDYLNKLLSTNGMGIIIFGAGILGFIYLLIKQPNKRNFIFLSFPIFFAIISIITSPGYAESRHQLPIYPFLAVTGGSFVMWLAEKAAPKQKIIYAITIVSLSWPLFNVIERAIHISKPDTRNIAKTWISNNIQSGTKILVNENGPQLLPTKAQLLKNIKKAKEANPTGQFTAHYDTYLKYQLLASDKTITYDITEIRFPWWRNSEVKKGVHELTTEYDSDMGNPLKKVGVHPYQFYVENDYQYAIVHSYKYANYFKPNSSSITNFPSFATFYKDLFAKGKLIKEFSPKDGNRPGPTVKIFKFQ